MNQKLARPARMQARKRGHLGYNGISSRFVVQSFVSASKAGDENVAISDTSSATKIFPITTLLSV